MSNLQNEPSPPPQRADFDTHAQSPRIHRAHPRCKSLVLAAPYTHPVASDLLPPSIAASTIFGARLRRAAVSSSRRRLRRRGAHAYASAVPSAKTSPAGDEPPAQSAAHDAGPGTAEADWLIRRCRRMTWPVVTVGVVRGVAAPSAGSMPSTSPRRPRLGGATGATTTARAAKGGSRPCG